MTRAVEGVELLAVAGLSIALVELVTEGVAEALKFVSAFTRQLANVLFFSLRAFGVVFELPVPVVWSN